MPSLTYSAQLLLGAKCYGFFLCISSCISSAQHTTTSYGTLYYNAASTQTARSAVQRSGQPSFPPGSDRCVLEQGDRNATLGSGKDELM